MTEVDRLLLKISQRADEHPPTIHIHGNVGNVVHIQSVQTLHLSTEAPREPANTEGSNT